MSSVLQPYLGSLLALLASLAFTLMDATAQSCMHRGVSSVELAFSRMALTLPFLTAYILLRHPSRLLQLDPRSRSSVSAPIKPLSSEPATVLDTHPVRSARLIWLRSLLLSLGMCAAMASMSRTEISEFIALFTTRTFLIGLVCWLAIGERFGWRLRIAAAISAIAIVLVIQPPFLFGDPVSRSTASRTIGFLFCVGSAVLDVAEVAFIRALGSGPDPAVMTLCYTFTCAFVSASAVVISGGNLFVIANIGVLLPLSAVTLLGLCGQISMVMALQRESGVKVSIVMYAQVPISILVQAMLVGRPPQLLQLLGMAVIVIAGIWAVVGRSKDSPPHDLKVDDEETRCLLSPRAVSDVCAKLSDNTRA